MTGIRRQKLEISKSGAGNFGFLNVAFGLRRGTKEAVWATLCCIWKSAIRNLKSTILVGALLLALSIPIEAQRTKKVPRIGYLSAVDKVTEAPRSEAIRLALRELGYVEGQNIATEYRYTQGKVEPLPRLAAELVRLNVDIIVVAGADLPIQAAKNATKTIPIVMAQDPDPVGSGFVASLVKPGGNTTGLATLSAENSGKQLELLKEIVPKLSRVAVLETSTNPGNPLRLRETELAAGAFKVRLQYLDVLNSKDIETAFPAATKEHADAVLVLAGPVALSQRSQILDLAVKSRLAVIFPQNEYVEDGGLMSYAPNYTDLFRRAATYVDKILNGAKPADLPVEQPTKFELVINLKAAKRIDLTIPPNVLAQADRVIR